MQYQFQVYSKVIQLYMYIYIHICVYSFSNSFRFENSFRLLQSIEQSSLCYTIGPCWLTFLFFVLTYLFLAVLGLRCCAQAFSSCGEWGPLFFAVRRLLIAVASLIVEHRLQAHGLQQSWHAGSVVVAHRLKSAASIVVAHGLSCSTAQKICGIFPDQGSNPCPLHWQADS